LGRASSGPAQVAGPGPAREKKIQKILKSSQKFVIFLNIFLPSLLNIGLYTYMVRYKSGIKTPGFLRNTSKKKFKKRKKYFIAYGQVLKNFPSMFLCLRRKNFIFLTF
jgi:hypothetical protein